MAIPAVPVPIPGAFPKGNARSSDFPCIGLSLARDGDGRDGNRPRSGEGDRTRRERGAGCHDVVDEERIERPETPEPAGPTDRRPDAPAPPDAKCPGDVAGTPVAASSNCATVARDRSRARTTANRATRPRPHRSARPGRSPAPAHDRRGRAPGQPPSPFTDPVPAPRHRLAERPREPALPGVLQLMQGAADGTGERRAPLELEQRAADPRAARSVSHREARAVHRATAGTPSTTARPPGRSRRKRPGTPGPGQPMPRRRAPQERHGRSWRGAIHRHVSARPPRGARVRRPQPGRLQGHQVADDRARSLDRANGQLQHAVCAPDEWHEADPRPQPGMHGKRARPPAGVGLPRKTASIGNRMNIMWIPLGRGSTGRVGIERCRPMRPMNRAHRPAAVSSRVARTVPRACSGPREARGSRPSSRRRRLATG